MKKQKTNKSKAPFERSLTDVVKRGNANGFKHNAYYDHLLALRRIRPHVLVAMSEPNALALAIYEKQLRAAEAN